MVARRDLIAVASLNIVQGLPTYFFTLGLPALMREAGASLDVVALTYIVWLPWALKWLWAPHFDKSVAAPFGPRIVWLRVLPILMAACFATLTLLSPSSPPAPLLSLALACAVLGATLQVVLAAFVLDRFGESERAMANGLQVAGMTAGSVIGGGVLLYLGEELSWHGGIVMVVILILLTSLPAWHIRWPINVVEVEDTSVSGSLRPWRLLSPGSRMVIVLMVLAAGGAAGDALIAALLIDNGFSSSDVGWMLGMVALCVMIPVSAGSGMLVRAVGARRALAVLLALKAALSAVLSVASQVDPTLLMIVSIGSFCLGAATMVAFWQIYMAQVTPSHAATGFAFFTSLEALFLMIAGIGGGQIATYASLGLLYGLSAMAALLCALLVATAKRFVLA